MDEGRLNSFHNSLFMVGKITEHLQDAMWSEATGRPKHSEICAYAARSFTRELAEAMGFVVTDQGGNNDR